MFTDDGYLKRLSNAFSNFAFRRSLLKSPLKSFDVSGLKVWLIENTEVNPLSTYGLKGRYAFQRRILPERLSLLSSCRGTQANSL